MSATVNVSSKPVRYLGYIDAIRGLGILGVLVLHSSEYIVLTGPVAPWAGLGARGVQLFYIASAFTLFLSYDGRKNEARPTQNFFIRRFFRIAPAFYVAMAMNFLMLLRWPYLVVPFPHLVDFVLGVLFLHGFKLEAINSVTRGAWSVADETIFYAMIPWLHRQLRSIKTTAVVYAASAIVLGSLSAMLALRNPPDNFFYLIMWFPVEFPIFILGILLYQVWKQFGIADKGTSQQRVTLSLLLILCAANLIRPEHQMLVDGFGAAALVLALTLHPWKLFVNRFTRYMGKISYSMYLFHFYVLHMLNVGLHALDGRTHGFIRQHFYGHLIGFVLYFLILLGLSAAFCTLTWRFIEEPFVRLGRRVIEKRERRFGKGTEIALVPAAGELLSSSNTPDNQL